MDMVHLWNLSRRTAIYEDFVAEFEQLARNSLFRVVVDRETDRLIGYGQAYNASPWDRWTYLAAYVIEEYRGKPHFIETAVLSLDELFKWLPVNKVYLEVYEFAHWARLLPSVGFVEEGVTPNHFWHDGRYWAITKYALYREAWAETRQRLLDILNVREHLDKTTEPEGAEP